MTNIYTTLYEHFVTPLAEKSQAFVGIELEYPLLALNPGRAEPDLPFALMQWLCDEHNFAIKEHDLWSRPISVIQHTSGDRIAFEYSVHMLEFSLARSTSILAVKKRFDYLVTHINAFLLKHGYLISGFGLHPFATAIDPSPQPHPLHAMVRKFLMLRKSRSPYYSLDFFSLINASQIHLDCRIDALPHLFNLLSKLDWVVALLFANSPSLFYRQDLPLTWCARDAFYRASAIGLAPHDLGPYDQHLLTCDDLIARFAQCAIWHIQDAQGRYIFFPPLELAAFLECDQVCGYLEQPALRWSPFTFKPEASHLRSFKGFKDITFTRHNTIEFRGCCQQPLSGAFEPAAFITGCAANIEAALAALAPLNNLPPNSQMRRLAVTPSIFEHLPRARLRPVISALVDAAAQGLIQRGYGEESLLDGIYERADRLICPASVDVERRRRGMPLEEIIHLNASVTTPATVMDNGN